MIPCNNNSDIAIPALPSASSSPMQFNVVDDTLFILLYGLPTALLCYMLVVSAEARGVLSALPVSLVRFFFSTSAASPASATRLPTAAPLLRTTRSGRGPSVSHEQWRAYSTRKFSPHQYTDHHANDNAADEMLKREVERHNSAAAHKKLAKQLFSSSPPSSAQLQHKTLASSPPTARSLTTVSGNILAGAGIKRSASGLAKSLSVGDGFDMPTENVNSQRNPIVIGSPRSRKVVVGGFDGTVDGGRGVYFDENDFDSDPDLDLEVEDPATKSTVQYPRLPAAHVTTPARARSNMAPTSLRQQSAQPGYTQGTLDSGYESQQIPPPSHQTPGNLRSTPASQLLPWSSSPLEHMTKTNNNVTKTPIWDQYAYGARAEQQSAKKTAQGSSSHFQPASTINTIKEESSQPQPPPAKRRNLPWVERQAREEARRREEGREEGADLVTPAAKKRSIANFPWNTSASAIKEQQKQLRQANKKLVKDNEPTIADRDNAIAAKKKGQLHRVFLSEEQKHVLDLVVEDKMSVFFTGSAGTGKSVLLREIIAALRKKYMREPDRIAVTASTGLAACNIGGVTLHSFAGIGLGKEDAPTLVKKIRRNQKAKHRWMRTKVLVIDEVSMVDGELFDKLEEVARIMRNNGRPFGGIQLVITGDFFQLPPVPEGNRVARFAFEAGTWTTSIEHTIALHHVFRQKDPEFAAMLNEMREGKLSNQSIARFRTLNRMLKFEDELEATELFPTRFEVDRANQQRMTNLQGELRVFEARDGGSIVDKAQRDKLLSNCMAPEALQLKKGAQVMLIKNIDETLVNGSIGKVIGFMSETMFDNYQQNEEEYYATQGPGVGEGELSEKKTKLQELAAGSGQVFPVVRFAIADGSSRDLLCQRENWKVELPNGEVQASRAQIPLILAWALSIHKAQGQTLERVKVDLGKVFEKGQAYVALSRATSMKGLQIVNFQPSKVMAHEKVRTFYEGLKRLEVGGVKYDGAVKEKATRREGTMGANAYEKDFVGDRYLSGDYEWDL